MAKKKPKNSAKTVALPDYSKIYKDMQNSVNQTSIELQKMADATTAKTFAFNKEEAEKARNWQTEMSNTSHQREVADLKKAGLNPVLSANSGAQSYTTSSASGSAENPANAVAQLESGKMAAAASSYGANVSARATEKAAHLSSAATMAAAQQQAQAQKYATDMNYKLGVYKAGLDYSAKKYAADRAYQAVLDRPVSNVAGLVDKYFGNTFGKSTANKVANIGKKMVSNAKDFFVGDHNKLGNFKLNASGKKMVVSGLKEINVVNNGENRTLFVNGVIFGDPVSLKKLKNKPAKKVTNKDVDWF